jgi:hypothetical protein
MSMSRNMKKNLIKPSNLQTDNDSDDMMTIMESDLEDYEVAAELGMSLNQVSKIRRELFED